jgi:hypothetical protein
MLKTLNVNLVAVCKEHLHQCSVCDAQNVSTILVILTTMMQLLKISSFWLDLQVFSTFPTSPIKLKLGLQLRERLLNSHPLEPIKLSTQSET